jgi:5-oxoprolinase (ATP-hydrolysing)
MSPPAVAGARMALLVTKGFRDLLHIGNQSRPLIFDLRIEKPENLYETVVEVEERLVLCREGEHIPTHISRETGAVNKPIVIGSTGEHLIIEQPPNVAAIREQLTAVFSSGIQAVAIAFINSYTYPEHERIVGNIAREIGFTQISLSSDVMPMVRMKCFLSGSGLCSSWTLPSHLQVKIVPRGYTACADAYLTPHIVRYVNGFRSGFKGHLQSTSADPCAVRLSFMQSDGGLTPVEYFSV